MIPWLIDEITVGDKYELAKILYYHKRKKTKENLDYIGTENEQNIILKIKQKHFYTDNLGVDILSFRNGTRSAILLVPERNKKYTHYPRQLQRYY